MSTDDNASLLSSCRAGSPDAWEALVRRYQRLVYSVPRRAGLSDDAAEEVFQQVWVRLFESLDRIEQPERLAAWLVTTARRASWQQIRARRATVAREPDLERADELEQLADTDLLPDELLERLERQQLVRESLTSLEARCRSLLTMLFYTDQPPPYSEVAAALGLPEGSIGPTRARCLRKLQRMLEERED